MCGRIYARYGVNPSFKIKQILYHAVSRYDLYGSFGSMLDCWMKTMCSMIGCAIVLKVSGLTALEIRVIASMI